MPNGSLDSSASNFELAEQITRAIDEKAHDPRDRRALTATVIHALLDHPWTDEDLRNQLVEAAGRVLNLGVQTMSKGRTGGSSRSPSFNALLKLCEELGVGLEDLDEEVHEAKAEEAAGINNGGLDDQLGYLHDCGLDDEDLKRLIQKLAKEKHEGR